MEKWKQASEVPLSFLSLSQACSAVEEESDLGPCARIAYKHTQTYIAYISSGCGSWTKLPKPRKKLLSSLANIYTRRSFPSISVSRRLDSKLPRKPLVNCD